MEVFYWYTMLLINLTLIAVFLLLFLASSLPIYYKQAISKPSDYVSFANASSNNFRYFCSAISTSSSTSYVYPILYKQSSTGFSQVRTVNCQDCSSRNSTTYHKVIFSYDMTRLFNGAGQSTDSAVRIYRITYDSNQK